MSPVKHQMAGAFDDVEKPVLNAAKFLRDSSKSSIKIFEGIMAEKRVDVFKGSSAIKALLSDAYKKTKKCTPVHAKEDAEALLQSMLNYGFFIRSTSVNGSKFLQPDLSRKWSEDGLYVWVLESSQFWTILGALGFLAVSFALVMFPLWPASLRNLSWYVMMALVAFMIFLIVTSIVRLIVFGITYFTCPPGIWIFPNLFEDVGFIESFIPLWDWHKVESASSKDNDKKKTN